ncbi:MAG: alpha/beta hydrolase family protein [Acidobacteriota bacterium]
MSPLAFEVPDAAGHPHSAMLYPAQGGARLDTLFVFAHGAGAGQSHPFMVRVARGLAERGVDVVTFNFPYLDAGRRAPDRAPVLEASFRRVVVAAARQRHVSASRLVIGGKSMGGRMATHLAAAPDDWPTEAPPLDAVVVFGYPLNPPGGSTRTPDRVSHLRRIQIPTLIVQGTRDAFGGPADIANALAGRRGHEQSPPPTIEVQAVEGGDHSLSRRRAKTAPADFDTALLDHVAAWMQTAQGASRT